MRTRCRSGLSAPAQGVNCRWTIRRLRLDRSRGHTYDDHHEGGGSDERAGCAGVRDPRRRDAGARRPGGGPHRRLQHGGWSVPYFDDEVDAADGRGDGPSGRPRPRPEDLRDLRRPLAAVGRPGRRHPEQRDEVRRLADSQPSPTGRTRTCSRATSRPAVATLKAAGRRRAPGPRQRRADPDPARATTSSTSSGCWTFPVVLGPGKRLFGDGTLPRSFELRDSKTSPSGVVIATYRRAGDVEVGSFALDEPTDAEVERRRREADGS